MHKVPSFLCFSYTEMVVTVYIPPPRNSYLFIFGAALVEEWDILFSSSFSLFELISGKISYTKRHLPPLLTIVSAQGDPSAQLPTGFPAALPVLQAL